MKLIRHWLLWVVLLPFLVLWSYFIFSLLAALLLFSVILLPLAVAVAVWLWLSVWKD